jgi:uncharacterized protein (DUF3820 family)
MNCKKCESIEMIINEVVFSNGTKHLERVCKKCGTKNGYQAQEITMDKAVNFKMPFGKYKGELVSDICKTDRDYSKWCIMNLKDEKITKIFELLL